VGFLVAEETVGYGPCLVVESTSPRYLNLVPLMHQIRPLAGTRRGHAGLADLLQKASEMVETSFPEPPEFVAQGDRVMVVGVATGKIKATNKPFKDDWVFAITVRNGKLTNIREYIDTQALARASEMDASGLA
jgi:ketosteroid isomerase-like protein